MTGDLDSRPPRPFLPPLLVAGLVLWAATALIWPTLRLAPTAALPVLGMLALGAAVWLASHALRAARGGGFSLGALAALSLAAAVALCSFWGGALRGSMAYAEAQGGDSAPATWHAEFTEDAVAEISDGTPRRGFVAQMAACYGCGLTCPRMRHCCKGSL